MSELKLTGAEWAEAKRVYVLDPDGWRLNDGVRWDTPITESEFAWRCAMSTSGPLQ